MSWVVTRDDNDASPALTDLFLGQSCFLLCCGPSLRESIRDTTGVLTAAVNNAPLCDGMFHRPAVWCCCDPPYRFHPLIWSDAAIMKFVPHRFRDERTATWNGTRWHRRGPSPHECPNTFFYETLNHIPVDSFLDSESAPWGTQDHTDASGRGFRSVLLVSLWLLYRLGVRRLYLLGADFRMRQERPYAWDDRVTREHVAENTRVMRRLALEILPQLQTRFESRGFAVLNATANSSLECFASVSLDAALDRERIQEPPSAEGLYRLTHQNS